MPTGIGIPTTRNFRAAWNTITTQQAPQRREYQDLHPMAVHASIALAQNVNALFGTAMAAARGARDI